MAKEIPVKFSYRDKGLAGVASRLDAVSNRVNKKFGGLSKFNNSMNKLGRSFAPLMNVAKGAAVAVGGLLLASAGLGAGFKGALDAGGRLSDLSSRTGIAADKLAILEQAFKNNGMAAEQVGPAVNKLQRAVVEAGQGLTTYQRAFDTIGVSWKDLEKMSPDEQFDAVRTALAGIADPTARAAAAMQIFGRSGGQMLTLFADGGAMTEAARNVGEQATILRDNADLFDKISDQLGLTGVKTQGFFVGMAEQIAPVIQPLMDFFSGTDFAQTGRQFGAAIALGIQALTDGSMWSILLTSAQVTIGTAINFLWAALRSVLVGTGQLLVSAFRVAMDMFSILGKSEFWSGMGNQLLAMVNGFAAVFYGVFAKIVEMMRPILSKVGLGGVVDSISGGLRGAEKNTADAAAQQSAAAKQAQTPFNEQIKTRLTDEAKAIGDSITNGFANAADITGTGAAQDSLDSQLGTLTDKVRKLQDAALGKGAKDKGIRPDGADGGDAAGKGGRPTASRLSAISGFGVFVKDPILAENRRQSQLLEKIAKNTEDKKTVNRPMQDLTLKFS